MINPTHNLRSARTHLNTHSTLHSYHSPSHRHQHHPVQHDGYSSSPPTLAADERPGLGAVRGLSASQMRLGLGPAQPGVIIGGHTEARGDGWEMGGILGSGSRGINFVERGGRAAVSTTSAVVPMSGRAATVVPAPSSTGASQIPPATSSTGTVVHRQLLSAGSSSYSTLHRPGPCPLGSYSALSPFATPRPGSPAPETMHPHFPTAPGTPLGFVTDSSGALDRIASPTRTANPAFATPTQPRGRTLATRAQSASPEPRIPHRPPTLPLSHPSPSPSLSPTHHPTPHPPGRRTLSPSPSTSPSSHGPAGRRTTFPPSSLHELQEAWDRGEYYPTPEAVVGMMRRSGLTRTQVRGWFANKRQRASEEERAAVAEEARRCGVAGVAG